MKPVSFSFCLLLPFCLFSQEPDSLEVNYPLFVYFNADHAIRGSTDSTFTGDGFYLFIDTTDHSRIEEQYLGAGLFLVNQTDSCIRLVSYDGDLSILAEAKIGGLWLPITSLMGERCGNSLQIVSLPERSWSRIETPVFKGPVKTSIRYVLYEGNRPRIRSNEIIAYIHAEQADYKGLSQGERRSVTLPDPRPQMTAAICLTLKTCRFLIPGRSYFTYFTDPVYVFNYVSNMPSWFKDE